LRFTLARPSRYQGGGAEHVAEISERVSADHLRVVVRLRPAAVALRRIDVEVVAPKFAHHLEELALAIDRAQQGDAAKHRRQRLGIRVVLLAERLIPQVAKACDGAVAERVVNGIRRELLLDECLHAHRRNPRVVAGAGAKGEPVQRVRDRIDLRTRGRSQRSVQRAFDSVARNLAHVGEPALRTFENRGAQRNRPRARGDEFAS
jgi:hypothetical protein